MIEQYDAQAIGDSNNPHKSKRKSKTNSEGYLVAIIIAFILFFYCLRYINISNLFDKPGDGTEGNSFSIWSVGFIDGNASVYSKGIYKDFYGNKYEGPAADFCSYTSNGRLFPGYAFIDLNGEYDRFSGTIFARPEQNEELGIVFKIYADRKCVFESEEMHRSSEAIVIDLNISGVNKLEFQATSEDYNPLVNPGIILANATVYVN